MRYHFDITTSFRWSGHAVGIVRVERELARRARAELGEAVDFCVYLRPLKAFIKLRDEVVDDILKGDLVLTDDDVWWPDRETRVRRAVQKVLHPEDRKRGGMEKWRMRRYLAVGVLVPTKLIEDVVQERARARRLANPFDVQAMHPSFERVLELGPGDTIISAGLDWDHKDLGEISRQKEALGFRYTVVVYDLIPLLQPQYVVPTYVELLAGYFGELFWCADHCLCISETTAQDVRRHLKRLRIEKPVVEAFPLGRDVAVGTGKADAVDLPDDLAGRSFALYVSTIEPRKNHRVVYQAFSAALADGRLDPRRHALVFVGRRGWNIDNLLHEITTDPMTRDTVLFLENVDDATLVKLYEAARFVVFPSFCEGYGLPLAEALGLGKPCLSSNTGSLPEVGGDRATYLSPIDTPGWAEAMTRLFTDDAALGEATGQALRGAPLTTWDDSARVFFEQTRARAEGR